MNRIYSLVWNRALRIVQVASEIARTRGGGATGSSVRAGSLKSLALAIAVALVAQVTPAAFAAADVTGTAASPGAGNAAGSAGQQLKVLCLRAFAGGGIHVDCGGGGGGGGGGSGGSGATYGAGGAGGEGGGGYNATSKLWDTSGSGVAGAAGSAGSAGTGGVAGAGGAIAAAGSAGGVGTGTGGGGGGGGGGAGYVLTATSTKSGVTWTGGAGGVGGAAGSASGYAGGGGAGGAGLLITSGSALTLTGGVIVTGGAGGAAGSVGKEAGAGSGGAGTVLLGNASLTVADATIAGGMSGDGTPIQADAVELADGGNVLTLEVGSTITGNIVSTSGGINGDTLVLADNASGGGSNNLDMSTVSGFVSYEKTGTSTWMLTGSNAGATPWTFSQGILNVGSSNALGTGAVDMAAGTTLGFAVDGLSLANAFMLNGDPTYNVSAGQTDTISGVIADGTTPGTLELIGGGTLVLTATNTYTGDTDVNAGTLTLSGNGSIAYSSDVSVAAGATFDVSGTNAGASIMSLDGASNSTVNLDAQTLTLTNAAGTFAGAINGNDSSGLTISGGTETLSGITTFTGTTTIDNGATLVGRPALGAAFLGLQNTSALNLDNGTLALANAQWSTNAAVTLGSGGGTFSITGTTGGQQRYLQLNGVISGAGALTFIADGRDNLTLSNGGNTFAGGVTVTRATPFAPGATPALNVTATGALGTGDVTLNTGTGLQFFSPGNDANGNPIGVSAGSRTIGLLGVNTLNFQGNTSAGSATISTAGQAMGGSYINFAGGSDAGTSTIGVGSADVLVFNGGYGTTPGASAASAVIHNGLGSASSFAFTKFMSGSTAGNATIDNTYGVTSFYAGSTAGSARITNGYISATEFQDASVGNALITNAGSSYLPGAANANNMNYFRGGVLEIIGSTDASQATVVNNAGGAVYVSAYRGQSAVDPSIGSLSGAGAVLLGSNFTAAQSGGVTTFQATPFTLTLGALGLDDTISGVIRDDASGATGGVSIGDGILKVGTGTLTLDGVDTYTGLTEVADGTLLVGGDSADAAASIAGNAQVDSGATLGGFGTVGATGTITEVKNGGVLSPGTGGAIGALTFGGNLTLDGGSVLDYDLGAPSATNPFTVAGASDHVNVAGALTFNGGSILNLADAGGMGPGLYNLVSYGSLTMTNCSFGGGTACIGLGTLTGASAGDLSIVNNADASGAGGQIDLYNTAGVALNLWTGNGTTTLGGNGTWTAKSVTWDGIDPATNTLVGPAPMGSIPGLEIFQGTSGTVTVDDSQGPVNVTGLQFAVNGYTLAGATPSDAITLVANNGTAPTINVGDGTTGSTLMSTTISAVLAGTDGLTKTDYGTLVLVGENTFTGNITVSGGTLELAVNGARGNAGGIMVDNTVGQNATLKVDSGVAFDAQFWVNNGGVLDNSGSIGSAARNATVQGLSGTATVNNHDGGSILGAIAVFLDAGGAVNNDGAGTLIMSTGQANGSDGAAVLVQNGTGTVTNTNGAAINGAGYGVYLTDGGEVDNGAGSVIQGNDGAVSVINAGGTLRNAGTLVNGAFLEGSMANTVELTAGGAIEGNLGIGTNAASTLTLDGANATPQLYSKAVTGTTTFAGALTKTGSGAWIIDSDDLSSVAGTTLAQGTLQVGTGGTAGSIGNGDVVDDGLLVFDRSDAVTYTGVISGDGTLSQQGIGTLTLTGVNVLTGGVNVDAGTLVVSSDANLGAATNAVTLDGGTLENTAAFATARGITLASAGTLQTDADLTDSGVIAGAGALIKAGAGALILTGANTWTGGTTISAGTLQVGNGGTAGVLTGAIVDNGTLVFDRGDAVTYDNAIAGRGTLTQAGSGTLTLNAVNPLAGTTTVQAGTLIVGDDGHQNASLGGSVTVAKGATVGGFGTVGGLDLFGTLSPGDSIGVFHVKGDTTFGRGSTFEVEAAPTGQSDQLAVTGKTTIESGNTVVLAQPGNWAPRTSYTIITSGGGVSGTFAGVSDNLAFLDAVLDYQPDAVTLSLERNDISFPSVAGTANTAGVAAGANDLGWDNPLYNALVKQSVAGAQTAFTQLAGEYYASQQTARIDDSRYIREAMSQRLRNGDHDTEAAKVGNLTAWAHAWGHWGTVDSDGNAAKLADNGDGLLVGADMPVGAARIGVTGGASRNSLSINDRASWGRETSTWLGAFAGVDVNAFSLRGGFAYAWDRIPSNREINFPGYTDRLSGNASGDTLTGFVEGAWAFHFTHGSITPFLNVAHTKVETDASTEAGGAAALHSYGNTANVSFSTLGARGKVNLAHHLNLHGELGWRHAFGDTTPEANLQFVAGGPAFTEYGVPVAKNAGLGRIGIGWHQGNVALNADYEGLAGNGVKDQAAKVSVSITF